MRFLPHLLATLLLTGPAAAGENAYPRALGLDRLQQPAPSFALGNGRTLDDYRGRWMVLHFWATWCTPCLKELPSLDRLHARWRDRVAFFAVAIDEEGAASVPAFAASHDIHLPVLIARDVQAPERYWSWGVPATYLIDPNGSLVARALGPRDWDSADADALLSRLIDGVPGHAAADTRRD